MTLHTVDQLVNALHGRLTLLNGTSTDETYLEQARCIAEIILVRAEYMWRTAGDGDEQVAFRAAFTSRMTTLGAADVFGQVDDLLTAAESAATEAVRTRYLRAAWCWAQIIRAVLYSIAGQHSTW